LVINIRAIGTGYKLTGSGRVKEATRYFTG